MLDLRINGDRLWNTIMMIGRVGKEDGGVSRLALNDADGEARDLFTGWLKEEGLDIRVDQIGNIFGVRKGIDPQLKPVMMGSHLDTVKMAGLFDGALGVISGLEVIRFLNQNGVETRRPLVVAAFTNEEGARFQPDMMGSMVYTGKLDVDEAWSATDDDGVTVRDELNRLGYLGKDEVEAGCYLELHVEQGPVLHMEGTEIGVVDGVQGMAWWDGYYMGESNHAGTTPLNLRRDALLGAADLCVSLREVAKNLGRASVATMGRLHPQPDVRNVIPGGAYFTLDFRQYEDALYEEGQRTVSNLVEEVASKHGLEKSLTQTVDAKPVRFDSMMVDLVERKAAELQLSYKRMHSGAGHDAQFMSYICPTAMIFVPSIDGRSHCPEERTTKTACINGANVLLNCVVKLSNDQSF
jgi:N-carbamoyl-L-amino-acid hydrolase